MLVGERMTRNPVTITPDASLDEALELMRQKRVRRLPVLDEEGRLVGIVSEMDLLYASPSPATTLSVFEMHYLLGRIRVGDVMTREVITVTEQTPLEEAARIMADNKIGGLPVVDDGKLIGIITETDLFKIFLELLGAREAGVRLTMLVEDKKGELAGITGEIARMGGNIISLGQFWGDDSTNRLITLKVSGLTKQDLVKALEGWVLEIIDVRDMNE